MFRKAVKTDVTDSGVIDMPQPSLCAVRKENAVTEGENVVLTLMDGTKIVGMLQAFDSHEGKVNIITDDKNTLVIADLANTKIMHIPSLRQWIPAEQSNHEESKQGLHVPEAKQDFELHFKDGDHLEGDTLGFRTDRHALYLFPAQNVNQYIYSIVPHAAIDHYRIGPKIGEILVEDKLLSEDEVEGVLSDQEEKRKQPLGEFLRTKAVVTAMELERALERQKSAPNLKLGEILVSENLISEDQLEDALDSQKQNRKVPLGEILLTKGLVTQAEIQQSLAKKLGIPFVDLSTFQIDHDAVKLIPESLAHQHAFIPLYTYDGKLVIALENPMDWGALDAVRFHTNMYIEPVMAPADEIERTISNIYSSSGLETMSFEEFEGMHEDDGHIEEILAETAVSDNVVVKLVNKIIIDAYHQGASDIHIEPYPGKRKTSVRIRKDGVLMPYYEVPYNLRSALVSRIKIMANLDISEKRKPQDGKIDFRKYSPLKVELRVATVPTSGEQEDIVMRILASGEPVPLDRLGMSDINLDHLLSLVSKPYGLFFVCGPTGSGKTTTLHSILGHLNTSERKIWTAEDPVEITQKGLRQVQVQPKIGFDFAAAMRSFLRADPDVIMVGEMRDQETTNIGVEASLTGHLVLSTLHTNSAPESIVRLLDMGMDPFNFADALLGILAQRLARKLCLDCKQSYTPGGDELAELLDEYCYELKQSDDSANIESIRESVMQEWQQRFADSQGQFTLFKAGACDECGHTGYRGRIGLHELMRASDEVKRLIHGQEPVSALLSAAIKDGMRTLKQDGIEKVLMGSTDIHQVRKVCIK